MKWISKLTSGLSKTSGAISSKITQVFTHKKLDEDTITELEDSLILSDLGVSFTTKFINKLRKTKFNKEIDVAEVKQELAREVSEILQPLERQIDVNSSPYVIMLCGVNGNGKTTTAGKLAAQFIADGKKVLLVAADTFRAAAIEQLEVWSKKVGCGFIAGEANSDPASVAYQSIERAKSEGYDVVIIDTAGRLQNKTNLMEQLGKIVRVQKKVLPEAPHHSVLVLDATTGQNALSQVETFKATVDIDSIVITKLDGSAKGGILVSIADKYKMPISYVGVGEKVEDLQVFNAEQFSKALFDVE